MFNETHRGTLDERGRGKGSRGGLHVVTVVGEGGLRSCRGEASDCLSLRTRGTLASRLWSIKRLVFRQVVA